jgi:hypothetical protein
MGKEKTPFENLLSNKDLFNDKVVGMVYGASTEDGRVGMIVSGKFDLMDRMLMIMSFMEAMLGVKLPKWGLELKTNEQKYQYLRFLSITYQMVSETLGDKSIFEKFLESNVEKKNNDDEEKELDA